LFVAELVVAVEHLHRSGSIHRDIKTDNILISTSGHVRLSDFGSSKRVSNDRCDSVIGFSVSIMPPEFFSGNPSYGSAIDWFQVGICAFEALTGQQPFNGRPLRFIDSPDYPPPWPATAKEVPECLVELVESLLHPDESLRLSSFEAIQAHPAFADFPWSSVRAGDPASCPFPNVVGDTALSSFPTPRMMSSVSSDHDYDPLPFKSFGYIRP
jgi:serine/threonine protein kinase